MRGWGARSATPNRRGEVVFAAREWDSRSAAHECCCCPLASLPRGGMPQTSSVPRPRSSGGAPPHRRRRGKCTTGPRRFRITGQYPSVVRRMRGCFTGGWGGVTARAVCCQSHQGPAAGPRQRAAVGGRPPKAVRRGPGQGGWGLPPIGLVWVDGETWAGVGMALWSRGRAAQRDLEAGLVVRGEGGRRGGVQPPPPPRPSPGGAELLEAPKAPKKVFGPN